MSTTRVRPPPEQLEQQFDAEPAEKGAPEGDQMELVEIMEVEGGLIKRHRVYWGWYALSVLRTSHPG
jgi:hypothetical protein